MGLLDFIRGKQANPNIFAFLGLKDAPSMKGEEYLKAYSFIFVLV